MNHKKKAGRPGKRNEMDMLHGPLLGRLILFALPLTATSILQQLFNSADTAVVGRFVSNEAQAAVGANSSVINLLVNTFVGVSVGANVVIAGLAAQRNAERIHKAVHTTISFALLLSVFIFAVGELIAEPLLRIMSTPDDVMELAVRYLRIYLCGVPLEMTYNFGSAILRSRGDSKRPLYSLFLSGIINVFLNLFFVLVCHMNVEGVAYATVISNGIAAGLVLHYLMTEDGAFRFRFRDLCVDRDLLHKIVIIGAPAGLQGAVFSISNVCVQSAINSFGSEAVAGASIALYFDMFTYYFSYGFSQACLTFASQNHAVGQEERCRRIFRLSVIFGALFTFSVGLIFNLGKRFFLGLYTTDAVVLSFAAVKMLHSCLFQFLEAPFDMAGSMLRSYDHPLAPAMITIVGTCVFRLAWVFWIFPLHRNFGTLMNCYPISWILTDILMLADYWYVMHRRKALS